MPRHRTHLSPAVPDSLADNYRRMPDDLLRRIALHEAAGLTPEALRVLHAELEARGIDPAVGRAVEMQRHDLSTRDVDGLVAAIQARPCPSCGRSERPLNAGIVADARSFILVTLFRRQTVIGCPDCLAKEARRAALVTALLGWWGFPFGPIRAVQALYHDIRTMRLRGTDEPSEALRTFVMQNPGPVSMLPGSPAR